MTKSRRIVLTLSLAVILVCGVVASLRMAGSPPTYDGSGLDLTALYRDPSAYDNTEADGAAAIIVNENLEKTAATNVVFSTVFNFRGYDTMGESFILIAAIAGSLVILRKATHNPHGKEADSHEEEV